MRATSNEQIFRKVVLWGWIQAMFLALAFVGLAGSAAAIAYVILVPTPDARVVAVANLAVAFGLFSFAGVQVSREYATAWNNAPRFI